MRLHRAPSRTYLPVKAPTTRGISATRRAASRNNGTSHPPAQLTRRDLALSLSLFSFSFSSSLSFSPTLPAHAWSFSFFPAQQAKLMDAEFANTLINAMTAVAGTTRTGEFQLRCAELRTAQLPVYESADACGHCGQRKDPGAFRDPRFFDFETYVRGKALLQMNTGSVDDDSKRDLYIRNANIAIGSYILKKILEERYTEDAEREGISPFFSVAALRSEDSLLSASPDLESVRAGVKTLLSYFVRRGFVEKAGVAQCGAYASAEQEEATEQAWRQGDGKGTLVYWLVRPVDEESSLRLQDEEGVFLGYVSATIAAFLRRCGVRSSDVQRVKSLKVDGLVIEKSKLVRIKPLAKEGGGGGGGGGADKRTGNWVPAPIPTEV